MTQPEFAASTVPRVEERGLQKTFSADFYRSSGWKARLDRAASPLAGCAGRCRKGTCGDWRPGGLGVLVERSRHVGGIWHGPGREGRCITGALCPTASLVSGVLSISLMARRHVVPPYGSMRFNASRPCRRCLGPVASADAGIAVGLACVCRGYAAASRSEAGKRDTWRR